MKYKNISEFRQSIILNGKRFLIEPNQVIESQRELKYIFLEKVSDDTPVTTPKASNRTLSFSEIKNTINEIKDNSVKVSDFDSLKNEITKINEYIHNFQEFMNKFEKYIIPDVYKKMEILKNAVMTLQEDVYNIKFDEKGNIIQNNEQTENSEFFREK